MNYHRPLAFLPLFVLAAACCCLGGIGCDNSAAHSKTPAADANNAPATATVSYTCPMHAEVVASVPGKCPKCGMELVVKK